MGLRREMLRKAEPEKTSTKSRTSKLGVPWEVGNFIDTTLDQDLNLDDMDLLVSFSGNRRCW